MAIRLHCRERSTFDSRQVAGVDDPFLTCCKAILIQVLFRLITSILTTMIVVSDPGSSFHITYYIFDVVPFGIWRVVRFISIKIQRLHPRRSNQIRFEAFRRVEETSGGAEASCGAQETGFGG